MQNICCFDAVYIFLFLNVSSSNSSFFALKCLIKCTEDGKQWNREQVITNQKP